MWGIKAGVDIHHKLLSQNTGVVEDAAEEPRTREVGQELQQICHPLPGHHGVQLDVRIANVYAFLRQVHICGQAFSDPYVRGQPFREYRDHIPSSIMAVHFSPFQSGHDVCSVDHSIVPKHLEASHHFIHGAEGAPDHMSVLRDVAVAMHEHLLLFSLLPLQVPLKCLTPALPLFLLVLLLFLLVLLAISGLVSHRDEDFFPFGAALVSGMPCPMSVQTPIAPHWFIRFPRGGLSTFVPVHRCRGGHSLGLHPHVVTGVHLPARHWQRTALRGRRLLGGRCHGTVPWWDTLCPHRVEKFLSRGSPGALVASCWRHGQRVYIIDFRSLVGGIILQFQQ